MNKKNMSGTRQTRALLGASSLSLLALGPVAIAPVHGAEPTALSEIRVGASQDTGTYTGSARRTAASRTDTPLIEVPQNVRVIPEKLAEDLGVTRFGDLMNYASGVASANDFSGTWDNYTMRGFDAATGSLINGFVASCNCGPQRDAATMERVEFLKGPSAALYGSSEPGGTYNRVTKKPQFTARYEAGLKVGTRGLRRGTVDLTGPLSQTVAYRLIAVAEKGATRTSLVDRKKYVLAPSITWTPDARTVVHYEADITRIRTPFDRGLMVIDGNVDALPRDRYLGEPGLPSMHVKGDVHQLTVDHALDDTWSVRAGVMYLKNLLDGLGVEPRTVQADGRTLTRRSSWRRIPSQDTSLQAEITGKLDTAGIRHTVLAGAMLSRYVYENDIRYSSERVAPYSIDIYAPVYGQPMPAYSATRSARYQRDTTQALYVQDQLDLSTQWKLMAGLRLDRFDQHARALTGSGWTGQQHRYTQLTPRVGATYLFDPHSAAFLSYGRSFRPNSGTTAAGDAFEPEKGTAWELGYKWDAPDGRLNASVSAFRIQKDNVLSTDPDNPDFSIATGRVRSQGVEADLAGDITPQVRLTASAAFIDAKVTRDTSANRQGKRFNGVPRVSGSLFALYHDQLANGSDYGVGAGLVHVGDRPGTATDSYRLPAYTTVNLSSYWQFSEPLRLTFNVDNLFDKTYYTGSLATFSLQPGPGRLVSVGVQYRF